MSLYWVFKGIDLFLFAFANKIKKPITFFRMPDSLSVCLKEQIDDSLTEFHDIRRIGVLKNSSICLDSDDQMANVQPDAQPRA